MKKYSILLIAHSLLAVDIGSDTNITLFNSQVTINDGDRIASGAVLNGGLIFSSKQATGIFDALFPISGTVDIIGNLVLNQDVRFNNQAEIRQLGNIQGNNKTIEFSSSIKTIPTLDKATLVCNTSLLTTANQTSNIFSADWSFDDKFIATGMVNSAANEITIYAFDGQTVLFQTSIASDNLTVYALRWHPTKYLLAVGLQGSATFNELRMYEFNPSGPSLTLVDSVDFASSFVLSVAWHPSGDFLAIGLFQATTDEIRIFSVDALGNLTFETAADIVPNQAVWIETLSWDPSGQHLAAGFFNSGSNPTLRVYDFSTSPVSLTFDIGLFTGATVASVDWHPQQNIIAIGTFGNPGIKLYRYVQSTSLTEIESTNSSTVYSVNWNPNGTCLITGQPVSGGIGIQNYFFDNTNEQLQLINSFTLASGFSLDTRWSKNGNYFVGENTNNLQIYEKLNTGFTFSDVTINLNSDLFISDSMITFFGESVINGRGFSLELASTVTIRVADNANLFFKNITLKGINNNTLANSSATSNMVLDSVNLVLDNTFTFTFGNFLVENDLVITVTVGSHVYSFYADKTNNITGKTFIVN